MTAIALKIRGFFSDLWFNLDLFFAKIFKSKTNETVAGAPTEKLSFSMRMIRMSVKDRLFFYDQMSTLIGSGVTLIDSLSIVMAQTKAKSLKKLYKEMIRDINTGVGLAETMRKFPHAFPEIQSALIEAAEKSGNLKLVLSELVEEMESAQDFGKKVTGAMFYPVILVCMALALVVGMLTFVIPKVAKIYKDANQALPQLTQTVINISNYVTANWQMLLIGLIGIILAFWFLFSKIRAGRLAWENIVSAVPILGAISKERNLMTICANIAMLMKSGVLINEAFAITEKTIANLHYKKALEEIRRGVVMGKEVSEMMGLEDIKLQKFKDNKYFPLQMSQLIHIGETTGQIAQMCTKLKNNFHKSIEYKLRNISTVIEPLMIFFVAIFVGAILLAVMLPFFNIGKTIS